MITIPCIHEEAYQLLKPAMEHCTAPQRSTTSPTQEKKHVGNDGIRRWLGSLGAIFRTKCSLEYVNLQVQPDRYTVNSGSVYIGGMGLVPI
jgi:hypothetical protein